MYSSKSKGRAGAWAVAAPPVPPDPARGTTEQATLKHESTASAKAELVKVLDFKGV
jgi:hypothetical protein